MSPSSKEFLEYATEARRMAGVYREWADEAGTTDRRDHFLRLAYQRDLDADFYEDRAKWRTTND